MSDKARIYSVQKLDELRIALAGFSDSVLGALDEAAADIQRTLLWLKQDRARYWKNQLRQRQEKYQQARLELKRKQDLEKSPVGGQYSFVDEKKALAAAQRKLDEAEEKIAAIQYWSGQLESEAFTCRGQLQGLAGFVDIEIPNARARLEKMMRSLDDYLVMAPPVDETATQPDDHREITPAAAPEISPTADEQQEDPYASYLGLRVLTPSGSQRRQIEPDKPRAAALKGFRLDAAQQDIVQSLTGARQPFTPESKILLADIDQDRDCIYLERIAVNSSSDSGWLIGSTESPGDKTYTACMIKDILRLRPDFLELLKLPAGILAVMDNDGLVTVFDGDDKRLWPPG